MNWRFSGRMVTDTIRHRMKKLAKSVLGALGYEVRRKHTAGFHASYVAQLCRPATVIDVGVGYGTYALYEAFPRARFVLIEPLRDYASAIGKISEKYDCRVFYKAVSDTPGTQEIIVDTGHLTKSSLIERAPLTQTGNRLEKRMIEVTTLDLIFAETGSLAEPVLLKIDTEGYELKALQGAHALLRATEIVIAEVSVAKRFEETYEFEDIIRFMDESGFYLLTFLSICHRRGELRPRFADVVFKKRQ
jgi:FkbM family methyltransferase